MSKRPGGEGRNPLGQTLSDEVLALFISFGRQLATRMAEESFEVVTALTGWTVADVEAASEASIARMEIALRDALTDECADPDDRQWQEIWTAMKESYPRTTANLLRSSGLRTGESLH